MTSSILPLKNFFRQEVSTTLTEHILKYTGEIIEDSYGENSFNVYKYDISNLNYILIQIRIPSGRTLQTTNAAAALYNGDTLYKVLIAGSTNREFYGLLINKDNAFNTLCVSAKSANDVSIYSVPNSLLSVNPSENYDIIHGFQTTELDATVLNYITLSDGTTTTAGNWKTHSFPVKKDHQYVIYSKSGSALNDRFAAICLYKNNVMTEMLQRSVAGQTLYYATVIIATEADTLNIVNDRGEVLCYEFSPNYLTSKENNVNSLDDKVIIPNTIFTTPYKEHSKVNIINRLYVEGIAKETMPKMKINDMPNVVADIFENTASGTYTKNIEISMDGYVSKSVTLSIKSTNPTAAKNKNIRLMCIGDSLTAGPSAYPNLVETLFKQWNVENGDTKILMVGKEINNTHGVIGDVDFLNRACNEGRGGWGISDYLRHICATNARGAASDSSSWMMNGKVAWDSLGLGTKTRNGVPARTYKTFVFADDCNELRTTCHGYYDADPTAELWDWIVNKRGLTSFTYNGITYTFGSSYSSADDVAQKMAIKYLCENWNLNPFFDIATVESSANDHAFNFSAYLNKYKTLATDGVTRLVVGSTAGTLVEDANAYDVVSPTHVSLMMNQNDFNNTDDGINIASDLIKCAGLIYSYDSSIKIAIGSTRVYGAFNPELYNNMGMVRTFFINGTTLYNLACYEKLLELSSTYPNYTILPVYAILDVCGTALNNLVDSLTQDSFKRSNSDGIHSYNVKGSLDKAYLVSSWLLSTL